jgi:hypothetical protein
MIERCPDKIREARATRDYKLGGREFERIRYGNASFWQQRDPRLLF